MMEHVRRGISEKKNFEKWHNQGVFNKDNNSNVEKMSLWK